MFAPLIRKTTKKFYLQGVSIHFVNDFCYNGNVVRGVIYDGNHK